MIPWGWANMGMALPAFLLVAARVSGLFLGAPLFGSTAIPARIKVALTLAVSATLFPALWPRLPADVPLGAVAGGLAGELLVGLVLGLGLNIIMMAAQMAGAIVGQQAGLSLAEAFDPNSDMQSTVLGEVFFFTATVIFLLLGGHRQLIRALLDSFERVPVMTFVAGEDVLGLLARLLTVSLVLAMKIAGPAILALLLAKASLGFLSRTMPQLHILSVGFAVFVSVGMLMSGLVMGGYDRILTGLFSETLAELRLVLAID